MDKITTLRNLRRQYSITQIQMSEILGVNVKTYRNKEEGYTPFLQSEMMKIIIAFNLSAEEAFSIFYRKSLDSKFWQLIQLSELNTVTKIIK